MFTRNIIPRVEVGKEGKKTYVSPSSILEKRKIDFSLKHLNAFGTQVTCYIPPDRREDRKTPGQTKVYDSIILGYVDNMQAYKVWDIKERKKREVSFFHSVVMPHFIPSAITHFNNASSTHQPTSTPLPATPVPAPLPLQPEPANITTLPGFLLQQH